MSDPVLDPSALERLRRIGGDKLLHAMIASFLENGAARVRAAHAAAAAGRGDGVSEEAHALKSSAGNLGATSLQHTAQHVERAAREPGADLRTLATELDAAFAHAASAAERVRAGTV